MNRFALLFLLGGLLFFPVKGEDAQAVGDLFKQAVAARDAGKFDDSVQAYEQIIETHPEAYERWYDAQNGITQTLIKKKDFAGAAQSAHLCLDAAPLRSYDSVVELIASLLSAQDKNVDRANRLIAFAQSGGGKDQVNPLDSIGYPALSPRETAFAALRQQAGDDSAASRFRALTFLFTGHPKDALAQYADALRRSDNNPNVVPQLISDMIGIALRDVRANRVGLDEAVQFVAWGPNGPDGKPGTADDLLDPFAQWLSPAPTPGDGGLAGFDAAGLATLRQVRDAAQLYGGDPFVSADIRHSALHALQRVTQALDAWGASDSKDWYLSRAFPASPPLPDRQTLQILLQGAELSARAGALHFGGVHDLWREIDLKLATDGLQGNKSIEEVRAQFDKLCAQISQTKFPKADLKPLQVPATF